ncbi:MAG: hypothetical protein KKG03_05425 [Gammaproteobacteria bacterium]|nr:hypothetical protein [Sideroxydans sp.]MBU3903918.1 hypothetical protein [Gammaproteobacteria bacterium]MBU4151076.1 hypothetical protein [Gammaproteobacteria bacterium]
MNKSLVVLLFERMMRIRLAQLIDERNAMKKSFLSILAISMLIGCASPIHLLDKQGSAPFVGGELVHDRGDGNLLVLEASDRRYEARGFVVERHTNIAALRKRYYGVNSNHWRRIFSGQDTDHLTYTVETVAKSADGQAVSCSLIWGAGAKPAGICTDQAGASLLVRFE